MKLLTLLNKLNLDLSESIGIFDMNIKSPLFVGFVGEITLNLLNREVKNIEFVQNKAMYKSNELYFNVTVNLIS